MSIIEDFNAKSLRKVPQIKPGDTVRVHTKIREGAKERVQIFEGVVLKCQNGVGVNGTITVRKISYGIGVEKTFLIHSPQIEKILVVKRSKVRRANIGYLRNLTGKSAKLKDKQFDALAVNVKEEELAPADKEEKLDEELTEIKDDVMTEAEVVSTQEIEKEEEKEASAGEKTEDSEDEQALAEEETEAGVEKAQIDLEKGKSTEGAKAEKVEEDSEK